jgi:gliding motility-associated-like protein
MILIRLYITLLILFSFGEAENGFAQVNLVLNPSFEDLDSTCVNVYGNVNFATNWRSLDNTGNPESCMAKLFNTCSLSPSPWNIPKQYNLLYQYPRTGNSLLCLTVYGSIAAGISNIRGYVIGNLKSKLIIGKQYCVTYYVNSFNNIEWFVNKCGCYFDDGTLFMSSANKCTALNMIPHIDNNPSIILNDTLGWMKIQGIYTANGNETRLTFGNFYNDANTGHVLFNGGLGGGGLNIDDISVIPLDVTAYAGEDAAICVGDSLSLGRKQEIGLECEWFTPSNSVPFSHSSNFTFKPTQTGIYTFIQRMDNCFTSYDTVNITVVNDCNSLLPIKTIPNVFTPNGDGVNDVWEFSLGLGNTLKSLTIVNRWGTIIKTATLNTNNYVLWDGRSTSGEACSDGVYFYTLEYKDAKGDTQKKNGYISLFR